MLDACLWPWCTRTVLLVDCKSRKLATLLVPTHIASLTSHECRDLDVCPTANLQHVAQTLTRQHVAHARLL